MTRQDYTESIQQHYQDALKQLERSTMSQSGKLRASLYTTDIYFSHPYQGPFEDVPSNHEEV